MRKAVLSIILAGGGLLVLASPAGAAANPQVCNGGAEHAHMTVPHDNHRAHAAIPHCGY